ncbi:MAG: PKD domain-containing protein [Bacteroidota bacterium]
MSQPLRVLWSLVILIGSFSSFHLSAQNFTGTVYPISTASLQKALLSWEVYQVDVASLDTYVKSNESAGPVTVNMNLGAHNWKLFLSNSNLLSAGYKLRAQTAQGIDTYTDVPQIAFKGQELNAYGKVRLTIDHDFLYGNVYEGSKRIFIEPLWYFEPTAPHDLFVVYDQANVIHDPSVKCGVTETEEELQQIHGSAENAVKENNAEQMGCYQIEIAIASDALMFSKYGSVGAVQAHNIGVMNDVQGDYTGNFIHDIQFLIVTQFVSTGNDPWTNSTNPNLLLDAFRTWGNAGNFGTNFDIGELWSNRDFDGGTVGLAWVGAVCTTFKYHVLQDFTSDSELLRCMTAHEIGHNFNMVHDGGSPCNFIMCPFVSNSSTWSTQSVNSFNAYVPPLITSGCLSPCSPPFTVDFTWSPNPACQGSPVQFTDQTTGTVTGWSWNFTGGNPSTSTLQNPTATWNASGTFNVKLTVTGPGGSANLTKQIVINPKPIPSFTYTVSGTTLTFTNTSLYGTSFSWDFGDGNFSTDQNPVHTYDPGGTYTVILTAFNDCGTGTKTTIVNTAPSADFSANPTSGCAPLFVTFTNESSSNASTYVWQFPGGNPSSSNLTNPVVSYNSSGSYTVILTAFNNVGSTTMTKTNYINVQNLPSVGFNFSVNGLTVTFNNTSVGGTSYLWNFGDNTTSTQTNPVHTYANGGVYTVTLTTTNACGSTTATKTVTLLSPPVTAFTATPTSGCAPLTVQFTNQTTGATSYSWQFPGGNPSTSTDANPSVVFANTGNYTVTLTASNAAGSTTATATISVIPKPTANFTYTANGLVVNFTNTSINGTSYTWKFGDDSTSTKVNPSHTYAHDGVYPVRLIATGPCGVDTIIKNVTVVTPPTAAFTASPTTGCAPLTVQFTSNSSANTVSYDWDFPGGTPDSSILQNPVIVYNTPGTYPVTLIVSNAAGKDTATIAGYIVVTTVPTTAFSGTANGSTATFTNSSTNATSYSWNFGDSGSSTDANPTHTYANDGVYTVVLTSTNACGTSTATHLITIATPPMASFTYTPASGCAPLSVQYTSTSSANVVSYSWLFPGGTPSSSTLQNPVVVYSTPGLYGASLTVTNTVGSASSSLGDIITVSTTPAAAFTSTANGTTVVFTNSTTNATSYSWNFGDSGTSTAANPTHTYANDGTYTVVLTATNACGSSTSTQVVTVSSAPTASFTANTTSGCAPLAVQFTSTSSANTVTYDWQFPGGTPSSSTAQNPLVTYNTPGSYSVTLTVGNSAGTNSAVQTNYITVGTAPTANFSATVSGSTATFVNASSGASSYSWDFGDGSGSINPTPNHTYANDGTYTVVLTSTNLCGTSTFTQNVVVITAANAGFTANTTTGCAPLTVVFQDLSSSNTTSWSWAFPGGTPSSSTEQNPSVTYNAPGVYDVTLIATSAGGSSMFTRTAFINVLDVPTAQFISSVSGSTATFDNASGNATAYSWNFGDGSTSTANSPSHNYLADGVYTVVLTATNNCGSSTYTEQVTIVTPPTAAFKVNSGTGCAPFTVTFENQSSTNATNFAWTFEGGTPATSTVANPVVVWSNPGVYAVTLVASNTAGTSTATGSITVTTTPTPNFSYQTAGLSLVLSNTSSNATSYSWNFGDGGISTETAPTHNYLMPGTYTVVLRATNACGTTETSQVVNITGAPPTAAFSSGESNGCVPFSVSFSDQSLGAPTSWAWSFPGGNPSSSTQQNPTVTYSAPGTYNVSLTVTNAFGSNSVTIPNYIVAQGLPAASFNFVVNLGTVSFTNNSFNATSYNWNFGDGSSSNVANPTHTYAATGTYTVELTAINPCGASTLQQVVSVTVTGTNTPEWLSQFRVFPNPNTGVFSIEMQGESASEVEFTLFNTVGELVKRETAEFNTGNLLRTFQFGEMPAAMYTMRIRAGEKVAFVKIAIQ